MDDTREVLSTNSRGQTDLNENGYFYACLCWPGLGLQAKINEEYGLLCDLLHETRNSLIWATTERDLREGAAFLIHHVFKGPDHHNGHGYLFPRALDTGQKLVSRLLHRRRHAVERSVAHLCL